MPLLEVQYFGLVIDRSSGARNCKMVGFDVCTMLHKMLHERSPAKNRSPLIANARLDIECVSEPRVIILMTLGSSDHSGGCEVVRRLPLRKSERASVSRKGRDHIHTHRVLHLLLRVPSRSSWSSVFSFRNRERMVATTRTELCGWNAARRMGTSTHRKTWFVPRTP